MGLEVSLKAFLEADDAIAALVSDRVHPVILPQGSPLPAITYRVVTGQREHRTTGRSGLARPRIQFDCWAATYAQRTELAEALRKRLDGFRGEASGTAIRGAFFQNEIDLFEPEPALWKRAVDFFVWFEEEAD